MFALCCAVMLAGVARAQNGINSPYSQYGIGLGNQPYNQPYVSSLGGVVNTLSFQNMINPFNPASYGSVAMQSFVFDMGLSIEMLTMKNSANSLYDADGSMGYLSFAFPIAKWWKTGFGIMPLSDVNYYSTQPSLGEAWGEAHTVYQGVGGVSQIFWGHAFNIVGGNDDSKPALRLGFNVNYLNGSIMRSTSYEFTGRDSSYFMQSRKRKDTYVSNLTYDFGLQYDQPVGEKYLLGFGVTFKPHREMNVKDTAIHYTYVPVSSMESIRDTIFPASGEESGYMSTIEQPATVGVGVSFSRKDKWLVALDGTFSEWGGMKYTENPNINLFGTGTIKYSKSTRVALGVQMLGDKNESRYMRRVTYSAGLHYEDGKLYFCPVGGNESKLNEWGFGVGMSLPMRKGRSVLNLSVAYSSFGTTDLLRRNAVSIGLSIGTCESWFVKKKYN